MTDPDTALTEAIEPGRSVLVDTSVVLAYIGGGERVSDLARILFDAFAATGRNPASLSTVTVAELLVRPFRRSSASVATAEGFLRHFGDLRLIDVDYDVAREAARIRAATDLPMPDSLIVGSAVAADLEIVVTNDTSWPGRLATVLPDLRIVVLSDLIDGRRPPFLREVREAEAEYRAGEAPGFDDVEHLLGELRG